MELPDAFTLTLHPLPPCASGLTDASVETVHNGKTGSLLLDNDTLVINIQTVRMATWVGGARQFGIMLLRVH
jgi:hypothetical protein